MSEEKKKKWKKPKSIGTEKFQQPKEKIRNFRWNCNQLKKKKRNLNIFPERNGDSRQRGTGETEARNCVQSGGNILHDSARQFLIIKPIIIFILI